MILSILLLYAHLYYVGIVSNIVKSKWQNCMSISSFKGLNIHHIKYIYFSGKEVITVGGIVVLGVNVMRST